MGKGTMRTGGDKLRKHIPGQTQRHDVPMVYKLGVKFEHERLMRDPDLYAREREMWLLNKIERGEV